MGEIPAEALKFKASTREKVRCALVRAIEQEHNRASTKLVSIAMLRGLGAGDQHATTELLRLWRSGALSVVNPWEDAPRPVAASAPAGLGQGGALGERVRAARTDGDREALMHELAALVADGEVEAQEAREIRGALAEARQAADAKREQEPPPEDPRRLLLASPQALDAARALDRLVSDARFDAVLEFLAEQVEADLIESPNADEGGA